jgi:hypothetical protein
MFCVREYFTPYSKETHLMAVKKKIYEDTLPGEILPNFKLEVLMAQILCTHVCKWKNDTC